jgi:hypothetical protein
VGAALVGDDGVLGELGEVGGAVGVDGAGE